MNWSATDIVEEDRDEGFIVNAFISLLVIVVAPVGFWLVVLEWAMPAFGFQYGMITRLVCGAAIGGFLLIVWAMIWNNAGRKPSCAPSELANERDQFEGAAQTEPTQLHRSQ